LKVGYTRISRPRFLCERATFIKAMKRFWIGLVLGLALGVLVTLAGIAACLFLGIVPGFHYVGNGRTEPPLDEAAQGGNLRVVLGGEHGHSVVFSRDGDKFVFSPPSGEVCTSPVVGADGRTALLLVRKEEEFGYNYGCLLRFDFASGRLSNAQPNRILEPEQLNGLFNGSRSWVNNLHKLSASGDRLLLSISTEDTNRSLGRMTYYSDHPYWYDLKSMSIQEIE
jgi:hypothetical protein